MEFFIEELYEEDIIDLKNNLELQQMHLARFHSIVQKNTNYKPQAPRIWMDPSLIKPVRTDLDYLQILYTPGHYVCCYYDTENIFIYDSLNYGKLTKEMEISLKHLFPHYDLKKTKFPIVQKQPNFVDCGIYAVASAVSLLFGIKPDKIRYEHNSMRQHLIKILQTSIIEHFPQDSRFHTHIIQPLNVALKKRYNNLAIRSKRHFEKKAATSLRGESNTKQKIANTKKSTQFSDFDKNQDSFDSAKKDVTLKKQKFNYESHNEQKQVKINTLMPNEILSNQLIKTQATGNIESSQIDNNSKLESVVSELKKYSYTMKHPHIQIKDNSETCAEKTKNDTVVASIGSHDTKNEQNLASQCLTKNYSKIRDISTFYETKKSIPRNISNKRIVNNIDNSIHHSPNTHKKDYTWQGLKKLELNYLNENDKKTILDGVWISDSHMLVFTSILHNFTNYLPYDPLIFQNPDKIKSVPHNQCHVQIIHGTNHWICTYYDTCSLYVYDSLNNGYLTPAQLIVIKRLYPKLHENSIKYMKVQRQPNYNDCGVFAIAFATSIVLGVMPDQVKYDHRSMRPHLLNILENHKLEHFPLSENLDYESNHTDNGGKFEKATQNINLVENVPKEKPAQQKRKLNTDFEQPANKKRKEIKQISDKKTNTLLSTFNFRKKYDIFIKQISNKLILLKCFTKAESLIEAEKIVKWCMEGRKHYMCSLKRTLKTLHEKSEASITRAKPYQLGHRN